jgi:hypothetical protein
MKKSYCNFFLHPCSAMKSIISFKVILKVNIYLSRIKDTFTESLILLLLLYKYNTS